MTKIIYLYVKTHKVTGLKYLGKTTRDPHRYKGSGKYWQSHLRIYGYDIDTVVLRECTSDNELREWGMYYSKLWNIVNAVDINGKKIWANEKPETGDGAPKGKDHHYSSQNPNYYKAKHPNYGKTHSESVIEKNKLANIGKNNPNYGTIWINDSSTNKKIKKHESIPIGWKRGRINTAWGKHDKNGTKNGNYDPTVYTFVNVYGTVERCTQRELIQRYNLRASSVSSMISKKIKSTGGWRIING